jgi:hypothetical protein
MIFSAQRSAQRGGYSPFDADPPSGYDEFLPGERVGPPLGRGRGKAVLRGVIILGVLGGGWVLLDERAALPQWLRSQIAAAFTSLQWRMPARVEPTASAAVSTVRPIGSGPAGRQPVGSEPGPFAPQAAAQNPTAAFLDVAPRPVVTTVPPATEAAPSAPLPPPTVDPADPYQRRAEAVGLHPELSRVLLARLSSTDYRNAGIAIATAIAETPDNGVLVWPRQRKPEQALFQVRFVPGAAPGCRRYVVSVTKDGWLTTALPMEKCGTQPRQPRRD